MPYRSVRRSDMPFGSGGVRFECANPYNVSDHPDMEVEDEKTVFSITHRVGVKWVT